MSHLFSAYDMDGTEIEVLDFIYSFVRMTKPKKILETGTWKAYGTIALATAIKDNGFGHLTTIEVDPILAEQASKKLSKLNLDRHVTVVCAPSLQYISELNKSINGRFDFSFFDSTRTDRPKEFQALLKRDLLSGIASFHDTSRTRIENHEGKDGIQSKYVRELDKLEKRHAKGSLEFALSRGLRVFQL